MGTVEALLMGVPVIGFNDGATPELVDEYSWILVGKKTIKNLISAIEQFQKRRWDRKGISERIRERILRLL
jgi:glycosyltransferase involved in cell wall biosynthesis